VAVLALAQARAVPAVARVPAVRVVVLVQGQAVVPLRTVVQLQRAAREAGAWVVHHPRVVR
jgi:hypothetical protein